MFRVMFYLDHPIQVCAGRVGIKALKHFLPQLSNTITAPIPYMNTTFKNLRCTEVSFTLPQYTVIDLNNKFGYFETSGYLSISVSAPVDFLVTLEYDEKGKQFELKFNQNLMEALWAECGYPSPWSKIPDEIKQRFTAPNSVELLLK